MLKCFIVAFLATALMLSAGTEDTHAQTTGQEVCTGPANGSDVFSVGEVRTSILNQIPFQELNGYEWVLMDGRPLLVGTALSPHLSEDGEYGPIVPDARGRFLRMANNNACADFRDDDEAYGRCIADHDPNGDRLLGTYQPDAFRAHRHNITVLTNGGNARHRCGGNCDMIAPVQSDQTTTTTGDNETRSKNVAVNFYVKICNCRTANCK